MKYLLTSIFILLFPFIASCMNQESDPSEKELVKIDDLEKQENRKLEKQENITRKNIPEINKITNKSDSGITSEQSTNKNSPSKKKLSKETTITTPAPTLTVIPTPIPIPKACTNAYVYVLLLQLYQRLQLFQHQFRLAIPN